MNRPAIQRFSLYHILASYIVPLTSRPKSHHISSLALLTTIDLLLQDDTIDARLEQCAYKTRLSFQHSQTI